MDIDVPVHWMHNYKMQKMTGEAFRTHVFLLGWSLSNGTDGTIPADIGMYLPQAKPDLLEELERHEYLVPLNQGWLLSEYKGTQSSSAKIKASLENRRRADRVRQAKHREAQKAELEKELEALGEGDSKSDFLLSRDNNVTVESNDKAKAEDSRDTSEAQKSESKPASTSGKQSEAHEGKVFDSETGRWRKPAFDLTPEPSTWDVASIPADDQFDMSTGELFDTCSVDGCQDRPSVSGKCSRHTREQTVGLFGRRAS